MCNYQCCGIFYHILAPLVLTIWAKLFIFVISPTYPDLEVFNETENERSVNENAFLGNEERINIYNRNILICRQDVVMKDNRAKAGTKISAEINTGYIPYCNLPLHQ